MARPPKLGSPTQPLRELYARLRDYHAARPWETLGDDEVFGVEDPGTGTVAWCSVLGGAGETFGLGVYEGTEGFALYQGIMSDAVSADDVRTTQRGFLVVFGQREYLEPFEIDVLRAQPGGPPARDAWPMVRILVPGYVAALPDAAACGRLSTIVTQVLEVSVSARAGRRRLAPDAEGRFVVRRRQADDTWASERVKPEDPALPPVPPFRDELRLRRVGRLPQPRGVAWECDYAYAPIVVRDGRRGAAYAAVVLVVDHASGAVLHAKLGPPPLDATFLQEEVVAAIESAGARPHMVLARTAAARAMLAPVAAATHISVQGPVNVPALEHARAALVEHMTRRS